MKRVINMDTYIGCSIIFYDDENRVLISKRIRYKKKFPLLWETIGGALENNETPEECIKREVMEEINCKIDELKLFKVYVVSESTERYVLIVYTGKIDGQINHNSEIEEIRWIEKSQINEFEFGGNDLEKILDYYGNHQ